MSSLITRKQVTSKITRVKVGGKFTHTAYTIEDYVGEVTMHMRNAVNSYAKLIMAKCQEYSKYQYASYIDLHKAGHPYSPRYPNNNDKNKHDFLKVGKGRSKKSFLISGRYLRKNPHIVSKQSGDFYKSWKVALKSGDNAISANVVNSSKHSVYLSNTSKTKHKNMIGRPIIQKAVQEVEKEHKPLSEFMVTYVHHKRNYNKKQTVTRALIEQKVDAVTEARFDKDTGKFKKSALDMWLDSINK